MCGWVVSHASHTHSQLSASFRPSTIPTDDLRASHAGDSGVSFCFWAICLVHASCLQLLVLHKAGAGTVVHHPHPCSTKACPVPDYSWPETSRVSRGSWRSLSLTREQIRQRGKAVVPVQHLSRHVHSQLCTTWPTVRRSDGSCSLCSTVIIPIVVQQKRIGLWLLLGIVHVFFSIPAISQYFSFDIESWFTLFLVPMQLYLFSRTTKYNNILNLLW